MTSEIITHEYNIFIIGSLTLNLEIWIEKCTIPWTLNSFWNIELLTINQKMLDQNDDKMVSLNPQGPDKTSTNVNGDGSDSAITLVLAIFSTIIPFLGFILTCVYWSSNRFRSWLWFGFTWLFPLHDLRFNSSWLLRMKNKTILLLQLFNNKHR